MPSFEIEAGEGLRWRTGKERRRVGMICGCGGEGGGLRGIRVGKAFMDRLKGISARLKVHEYVPAMSNLPT